MLSSSVMPWHDDAMNGEEVPSMSFKNSATVRQKGFPFFFKSDCPPDEQTSEEIIATSISSTVPSTH